MKKGKSTFRKINDWLHLWVGIITGIPIVIISLTGCLLVFEHELTHYILYRPFWNVHAQDESKLLPPSAIRDSVKDQLPDMQIRRIWYYGLDAPVKITPDNSDTIIYANPYTGQVLAQVDHDNFFHFIEDGHRELWLPDPIGHHVVSWCTAIFALLLITGIILWWPKKWNKTSVKNSFTIRWGAKLKRINYDLHNVLGFYSLLVAVLMALTGLIMGFTVVRSSVHWLAGGKPYEKKEVTLLEDRPVNDGSLDSKVDAVWMKVRKEYATYNKDEISIHFPKDLEGHIYTCTDMHNGTWRVINFDQQTLSMLSSSELKVEDEALARWLARSNFSLHVGAFGGIATKIIYFLASLICATLPITGFYIWWGKKKKSKK